MRVVPLNALLKDDRMSERERRLLAMRGEFAPKLPGAGAPKKSKPSNRPGPGNSSITPDPDAPAAA